MAQPGEAEPVKPVTVTVRPEQSGEFTQAGDTPISVKADDPVAIEVLSAEETPTEQFAVAFEVAADATAPVDVEVDAVELREAGLVDDLDRVALVELPACYAETPDRQECAVPVRTLTSGVDESGKLTAAVAPRSTMLAVAATPAGESGSFAAQPLAASSTWSSGSSTGEFNWSYAIAVPDLSLQAAIAPTVALNYNSGAVDGRIASSNNQPGLIGQGWSYEAGFIERRYLTCDDLPDVPATAKGKGDLCWAGHGLFLNFGDRSSEIVRDDITGPYRLKNDDGSRLERLTGAPNGVQDGEHWKLTAPDGTAYYFGLEALPGRTNEALTQSTWGVPVHGAKAGDPCYSATSFDASRCVQAWRWNLDYVEDLNNNAAAYYYNKETNFYAANVGATRLQYTRGGVPLRIDYGLRNTGGSVFGSPAGAQVVFSHAERCMVTVDFDCSPALFTTNNAGRWPDTPRDMKCEATGTCTVYQPTFWNQRRITNISTKVRTGDGTWLTRDSYALGQSYPDQGDTALWLRSISQTSYSDTGAAITRESVLFGGTLMANRVEGYNNFHSMLMWRLSQIRDENGAVMVINYTPAECTATNLPSLTNLSANTKRCFPVKWGMPGTEEPIVDFFHKYLVSSVALQDPQALSPNQLTSYAYGGSPAWHFDDNELVKPKDRTWGQFRGYEQVTTYTGDTSVISNGVADKRTKTVTKYLRGMHGDKLAAGGTRSATVTNSAGEAITDYDQYAGQPYETQTFAAEADTTPTSKALMSYQTYNINSATRARPGLTPLIAMVTGLEQTRTITATAAGGSLTSTTTYLRDVRGRAYSTEVTGTNAASSCTSTSYAENPALNIYSLPSETLTYAGTCPVTAPLLSGTRIYYDGATTLAQAPAKGNPTRTDTAITATEWGKETTSYDAYGRAVATTAFTGSSDTTGRTTSVAFVPATGAPVTSVTETNALGHTASTVHNIDGRITKQTTSAGQITEVTYDALGRVTSVWEPGFPKSGPATRSYLYGVTTSGPETITTKTTTKIVGTIPTQVITVDLYDAFGQKVQTQSQAVGGGRVVDDTVYDSHGWAVRSNNHWYTSGNPTGIVIYTTDSAIDSRTVNTYDSLGRVTTAISYKGLTETRRTRTIYSGDQTTIIPPAGAAQTATVTDALGNTLRKLEFTTTPTITGNAVTGGSPKTTSYVTDAMGRMTGMTDPTGATWAYTYNAASQKTKTVDPDTGTSTSTFNHVGEQLTSVDARGTAGTLKYTYDKLGRVTKVIGGVGDKTIAEWTYDTLKPGLLTESKSYANGDTANPFIQRVTGYDTYARPTGQQTVIPASQGALAGTYSSSQTYTNTGQVATQVLPALGGLPAETVTSGYTDQGLPYSLAGTNQYVNSTVHTPFGTPSQVVGHEGGTLVRTINYNSETLAVDATYFNGATIRPQIQHNNYTRNAAGMITKTTSAMNWNNPSPVRTMCYRYDTRARLVNAWTSSDNCAANPTSTNATTGGVVPIWHQWAYNDAGVRTRETRNKVIELPAATTTTNYTVGTTGQKHATASETATTGTTSTTTSYTYDQAGNQTKATTGTVVENLTWDAQGKLLTTTKSSKTTSYIRDADGNIILRKDPTGTTIYTAAGELRLTGTTTKTGTRFYSFSGQTVAQRVGTTLQALDADHTGTSTVAVDWADLTKTTWRWMNPYGNQINNIGTWQTDHTYLDIAADASTGYVQTGARIYNPKTGRFLSVDPILDTNDPNSLNGYSYTSGDPINNQDRSGLHTMPFIEGASGLPRVKPSGGGSGSQRPRPGLPTSGAQRDSPSATPSGPKPQPVTKEESARKDAESKANMLGVLQGAQTVLLAVNGWQADNVSLVIRYGLIGGPLIWDPVADNFDQAILDMHKTMGANTDSNLYNGTKIGLDVATIFIPGAGIVKGPKVAASAAKATKGAQVAGVALKTPHELAVIASKIKNAPGVHPNMLKQQVIAVGTDSNGMLVAASNTSSGFAKSQLTVMEEMGVHRAIARTVNGNKLHAEENLLGSLPDTVAVGTSSLPPCASICSPLLEKFSIPWASHP